MDPNVAPKVTPISSTQGKPFPHPSQLSPPTKSLGAALSSLHHNEGNQDPINGLFLTQLTRIFALKYALKNISSSRLLDSPSTSSDEIRTELREMLEDLNGQKRRSGKQRKPFTNLDKLPLFNQILYCPLPLNPIALKKFSAA